MVYFIAYYDSLMGCLNPELGLKFWTEVHNCPVAMWGQMCGLVLAWIWTILGLDLGLFYARVVACVVWPVMAICVDCFVGISYATIGRENLSCLCLLLIDLLGDNY